MLDNFLRENGNEVLQEDSENTMGGKCKQLGLLKETNWRIILRIRNLSNA